MAIAACVMTADAAGGQRSTVASSRLTRPLTSGMRQAAPLTAQSQINIYGSARDATNKPVPGAKVRLRNARTGVVEAEAVADARGDFVFRNVEPGMYVVEMTDALGAVIAAGEMVSVDIGQTVATLVKLPHRIPVFGWFSDAAGAIASAASSAGVLGVAAAAAPVSGER